METKYIPRAIVEWDDDTAKVPNGVKAEDVLRNPSLYNNGYAMTNWECWKVGGKNGFYLSLTYTRTVEPQKLKFFRN